MEVKIIIGALFIMLVVDCIVRTVIKIKKLKAKVLELEIELYLYNQLSSQVKRKKIAQESEFNKVGTWQKK